MVGQLRCELGEGPVWDDSTGVLRGVDVARPAVWWLDPDDGSSRRVAADRPVTAVVPRADGGWLAVAGRDLIELDIERGQTRRVLLTIPGPVDLALNDAVCGRDGFLYLGSVDRSRTGRGVLYRVGPDWGIDVVATGVGASNGVDTNADGTALFHADTFAGTVTRYPDRVRCQVASPDGLAVDAGGQVWIAQWGYGQVAQIGADCTRGGLIMVPVPLVTNIAFGGPGLATAFITTARSAGAELSGGVFACRAGVAGLPAPRFAG